MDYLPEALFDHAKLLKLEPAADGMASVLRDLLSLTYLDGKQRIAIRLALAEYNKAKEGE